MPDALAFSNRLSYRRNVLWFVPWANARSEVAGANPEPQVDKKRWCQIHDDSASIGFLFTFAKRFSCLSVCMSGFSKLLALNIVVKIMNIDALCGRFAIPFLFEAISG